MPENSHINVDLRFPNATRQANEALKGVERTINNIQGPLGRISTDFKKFDQSLEAANARVLAFGASVGVLYGIEKAFSSLIKTTITVEKKLTDINVLLGANKSTLQQFGKSLFDIARNTGQTFDQVATAAEEFSRQGLGMVETLKRTNDALVLARLTGLNAKAAMEDLTAAVNTFNKSGINTTQVVNKFANVDAAFAVSAADLAEALKRTGSSAAEAGVSIDELIALVTTLQQTTARGGAVIGNAIKSIFTRIERPEVLDQLQELGIQVRQAGQTLSNIKILENLAKGFDGLSESSKQFITQQVGSLYQINLLKAGLSDLSKENSVYQQALLKSQGATDQATQRNLELNKTLAAQINILKANLTELGGNIGESSVNPALKSILEFLNKGLSKANESLQPTATGIGESIAKGIIEGLGKFVTGPGIGIIGYALAKLVTRAGKDALTALNTVLGNTQAIQSAYQKEIGAGVPPAAIRLGSNPQLKNPSNPQGLGIYNLIHEPGGLQQGILKRKIPNFADPPLNERIFQSTTFNKFALKGALNLEGFINNLVNQFKTGAVKLNTVNLALEQVKKQFALTPEALKIVNQKIKRAASDYQTTVTKANPFFQKTPLQLGFPPPNPTVGRSFLTGDLFGVGGGKQFGFKGSSQGEFINLVNQAESQTRPIVSTALPFRPLNQNPSSIPQRIAPTGNIATPSIYSNQPFPALNQNPNLGSRPAPTVGTFGTGISVIPPTPFSQAAQDKFFANKIRQPGYPYAMPGIGLSQNATIARTPALDALLKEQKQISDSLKKTSEALNPQQLASRQNAALGIGLIAPIIGSILRNASGTETRSQRGVGSAFEALGQTASFAATGFYLGGGPTGAIAGGLLGLLTTLPEVFRSFTSVLPDLEKKLDSAKSTLSKTTDDLTQFVNVTEQLKAIGLGQLQVEPGVFNNLIRQQSEIGGRLKATNPDAFRQITNASGNLGPVAAQILANEQQKFRDTDFDLKLRKFLEGERGFFGNKNGVINDTSVIASSRPGGPVSSSLAGRGGIGFGFVDGSAPITTFGKKLTPENEQLIKEFAGFVASSKTSFGDKSIGELVQGGDENLLLKDNQSFSKAINELKNFKELSGDSDPALVYAGIVAKRLKSVFAANKEIYDNISDLAEDSDLTRRVLTFKTLGEAVKLSDDDIKQAAKDRDNFNVGVKKSRNITLRGSDSFDDEIRFRRRLELDSLRTQNRFSNLRLGEASNSILGRNLNLETAGAFFAPENLLRRQNTLSIGNEQTLSNTRLENIRKSIVGNRVQAKQSIGSNFIESTRGIIQEENIADVTRQNRIKRINDFIDQFDQDVDIKTGGQDTIKSRINNLKQLRDNFETLRPDSENITLKELDAQIKAYNEALEKFTEIQEEANSGIELEQDNLKLNLERINIEFENALKNTPEAITRRGAKQGFFFSDEIASRRRSELDTEIRTNPAYNAAQGTTEAFFNEWSYEIRDLYRDIKDGAADVSKTIKTSFSSTLQDLILGSKNAGEAFRNFGLTIANKIVGQSTDRTADLLFSSLGKLTGGAFKFSSGGPVRGGSGTKDDVPAMLQAGEYVIKKSAVQNIGVGNLNRLNYGGMVRKYGVGGSVGPLLNTVDKSGNILFDPRLSLDALEDPNNPQNAQRLQLEEDYLRRNQYEAEKVQALRAFRSQRRTAATFALVNAGVQGAALGFNSYGNIPSNASASKSAFRNTYQTPPYSVGVTAANGGIIPKLYANGGGVSQDNVPAMLTGGEYVVKKDVVDRYGKAYFDRLNNGGMVRQAYADGGSVGIAGTNSTSNSGDGIDKLVIALNSLTDSFKKTNDKTPVSKNQVGGDSINITINMTDNTVKSETKTVQNGKNKENTEQTTDKRESLGRVAELIKVEVHKILVNEKRAGGLLSTTTR